MASKRSFAWLPMLIGVSLLCSSAHSARIRVAPCPVLVAPYSEEAPTVDGSLNDSAWKKAANTGSFVRIGGEKAAGETKALILRSGNTLFIGVISQLPEGQKPKTDQTERDSDVWTDECVEVFIDPQLDFRNYFHLIVSAANVQRDEKGDRAASPLFDKGWNGEWRSATTFDATAWYAEIALPLKTAGLDPDRPALVGLNVCRNDCAIGESTCWSPTISGFHEPARFGVVSLPEAALSGSVEVRAEDRGEIGIGKSSKRISLVRRGADLAKASGSILTGNEDAQWRGGFALPFLPGGKEIEVKADFTIKAPGDSAVVVVVKDGAGRAIGLAKSVISLPEGILRDYGYRISGSEELGLWWAESTYKIHRDKKLPEAVQDEVYVSAAGHEFEAVQIVLRPQSDVDARPSVSDFRGVNGKIASENFRLLEVVYVPVNIPTDKFGWPDGWPDPLPAIEGPIHCTAGANKPIWLLCYVPSETPPGGYSGEVRIEADGKTTSIPVHLHVHGFALPTETHTRTAYGVSPNYGFLGLKDTEQKRHVYDLYMQCCREHRISPYRPMSFYPMDIKCHSPMRKLSYGNFAVEIETGQQHPWKLYWNGAQIAAQRTSMTHFEKEGVGWKGTGVGWPYIDGIESVTEVKRTPTMRVLDVVGMHVGSAPASRSFKLTFRVFIPAGDNWFGMRLMKMESTDETEVEVREYFNIPRTEFEAEDVANGAGYAAWSGNGIGFGMLCLGAPINGPKVGKGSRGPTVSNPQTFRIRKGQVRDGWGPLVVYFVTDRTSPEELSARAEELRKQIDPADPSTYVPQHRAEITEQRRDDYTFTHDFSRFDEGARRYLDESHFNAFNMPCMPSQIGGHPRFTDEYKRLHKRMYGPVIEHLRRKGWLQYAYSYWIDEPTEDDYPYVIEGMKLLGEDCPGLTRLLTEQPEEALHDVVDLWVPVLSRYKKEDCQARQANGDLVWWYVCCGPRAPYPNNFVDHPAINQRIRFWMAEMYGVTGSLYWSTTFYGRTPEGEFRNPWNDGMTYRPSGGYWGNGDGMLLYPACRARSETPVLKGPVVSIRWEMLRDGIEDREYFWTLNQEASRLKAIRQDASADRQKDIDAALELAQKALSSPGRLAESLVKFSKDPKELLREREALARAIEKCRQLQ